MGALPSLRGCILKIFDGNVSEIAFRQVYVSYN